MSDSGPKLSSFISASVAAVGLVGIFTEVVSYVAARDYLSGLYIEPDSVGITPLNAALKMTDTAQDVFFRALALTFSVILVVFVLRYLHSGGVAFNELQKKLKESIGNSSEGVESSTSAGRISRDVIDLEKHSIQRRLERIERFRILGKLGRVRLNLLIAIIVTLVCIISLGVLYVSVVNDAFSSGAKMLDGKFDLSGSPGIALDIANDLSPVPVEVQWVGPGKCRSL